METKYLIMDYFTALGKLLSETRFPQTRIMWMILAYSLYFSEGNMFIQQIYQTVSMADVRTWGVGDYYFVLYYSLFI